MPTLWRQVRHFASSPSLRTDIKNQLTASSQQPPPLPDSPTFFYSPPIITPSHPILLADKQMHLQRSTPENLTQHALPSPTQDSPSERLEKNGSTSPTTLKRKKKTHRRNTSFSSATSATRSSSLSDLTGGDPEEQRRRHLEKMERDEAFAALLRLGLPLASPIQDSRKETMLCAPTVRMKSVSVEIGDVSDSLEDERIEGDLKSLLEVYDDEEETTGVTNQEELRRPPTSAPSLRTPDADAVMPPLRMPPNSAPSKSSDVVSSEIQIPIVKIVSSSTKEKGTVDLKIRIPSTSEDTTTGEDEPEEKGKQLSPRGMMIDDMIKNLVENLDQTKDTSTTTSTSENKSTETKDVAKTKTTFGEVNPEVAEGEESDEEVQVRVEWEGPKPLSPVEEQQNTPDATITTTITATTTTVTTSPSPTSSRRRDLRRELSVISETTTAVASSSPSPSTSTSTYTTSVLSPSSPSFLSDDPSPHDDDDEREHDRRLSTDTLIAKNSLAIAKALKTARREVTVDALARAGAGSGGGCWASCDSLSYNYTMAWKSTRISRSSDNLPPLNTDDGAVRGWWN